MFSRDFVFVMLCCDWEVVTMQLFNFTINLLIVGGVICYLHHLIFRFLQLLNDLRNQHQHSSFCYQSVN